MLVLALIVCALSGGLSEIWGLRASCVGQASLNTAVSFSSSPCCFCLFMILPLLLTLSFTSQMLGKIGEFAVLTGFCRHNSPRGLVVVGAVWGRGGVDSHHIRRPPA